MLVVAAAALAAALLSAHVASAVAAALARKRAPPSAVGKRVSLVIPLCGVEPFSEACLAAALAVDDVAEVIFCVERESDPVIRLALNAMAAAPGVASQLLIGRDIISANPMLNNLAKGWAAARGEWVALVNSNVLMPRDYIAGMLREWKHDTGAVCAPPVGTRPGNFFAEIECAWLNSYQARWQYAAAAAGNAFAQGKGVLWRKAILDANGGLEALGTEAAEDAATTKLLRSIGLRVRLAAEPSYQPLGRRSLRDVWRRQVRWARLRRVMFPAEFAAEVLSFAPLAFGAAWFAGGPRWAGAAADAWYAVEVALIVARGWPLTRNVLLAMLTRDALQPAVWLAGWLGSGFEWRGNAMTVSRK